VKANIGHLEAAAGMAGFVAAMLVASSRQVYPNKELKKLNKYVADAIDRNHMNGLVRFPTMHPEQIRFASANVSLDVHCAVHSFGYSGTISSIVMCQGNVFWGNRLLRENLSEIETVSWPMSSLSGTDYLTLDTDEQQVPMQEEEEAEGESVTEKDIAQLDFHEIADIVSKIILESIGGTLSRMLDSESTVHPSDENNSAKLLSRLEKENEDLANYGMDSVLATDLSIIINNRLQTNLTAGIILEAKSVRNIIASVMDELNIANTIFAKAASISTGFLFRQCPWFANYLPAQPQQELQLSSDSENSLFCRIVVFSGMAQPVASWHKFVQPWVTQYNFSVHLVRLPGRYERFLETPLIEIDAIAEEVCKTMEEFGWLRPVNNANGIEVTEEDWVEYSMQQPAHKLVVLGYSSGCAIAYECVRMLQHSFAMPPDRLHLVCLNGPDRQVFGRWEFLPYTSRSLEDFVAYHIKSFGRMNPHFDLKAAYVSTLLDVIFEVFHRDNATSMSWMTEFDNRPLDQRMISCPITAVIGDEDIAVRCCGWKEIGSGKYDQFTYPGDHFFVYHDADLDLEVASDIARSIK
jgi:surfactin synthase thioesterase subunit